MAQNNLLGAGKRLAIAAKGRAMSAAQQKVTAARKKVGAVGSTGARLARGATAELNKAAMQLEGRQSAGPATRGGRRAASGSTGPSTRGGKRGAASASASPLVDKKPVEVKRKPVKKSAKAKPAKAAPAAAAPAKEMSAREAFNAGKTSATTERVTIVGPQANNGLQAAGAEFQAKNGKRAKRDIKVGALIGRTGGKWHLGRNVGKG